MELPFVNCERGCPKLIDQAYLFNKERSISNKMFWMCKFYYEYPCPAWITTTNENIELCKSYIGHVEIPANVEAAEIKDKVLFL